MKKAIIILAIMLLIPMVSAELAFEFFLEEQDGELQLQEVGVVEVPENDMGYSLIGEYLMVIGEKGTEYEYIDGAFFTLPETTIKTYVGEDGGIYSEYEKRNRTTIYIPYDEDAEVMKIFRPNGENLIHYDMDKREHLPPEDAFSGSQQQAETPDFKDDGKITSEDWDDFFSKKKQEMEELKKQESTRESYLISLVVVIAALVVIIIGLTIKLRREKKDR